jgi:alpha/beta superfamily hydrolase
LVRALHAADIATLRFKIRGVGASEGRHAGGLEETHDVAAAVECLAARVPHVPLTVAGYSFGAAVALRAGYDGLPGVTGLVGVAPPVVVTDLGFLTACTLPVQLVAGELDTYCPRSALDALVGAASAVRVAWIAGADHFLVGREAVVAEPVVRFVLGGASR